MSIADILYDSIGTGYNNTRQADPHIADELIRLLVPKSGKRYLDIGCGTGNYTALLASRGLEIWGVDPSEKMLLTAKSQSQVVTWLMGSAEQIPVQGEAFDGIVGTLTIHHWTNLVSSFAELYRVLTPGSKVVLFTATPDQMKGYWLNHYFPEMLQRSIGQMPAFNTVLTAASTARFKITQTEKYFVQPDLKDLFLYAGKDRPEIYYDDVVRQGISSFATLGVAEEVSNGLAQLQQDVDTKVFNEIYDRYRNDMGDYLFIVFEKG